MTMRTTWSGREQVNLWMSTGNLRVSLIKTMQEEKGKWHLGLLVGERSMPPESDERSRQRLMSFLDVFDSSQPHTAQGDMEKWTNKFGKQNNRIKSLSKIRRSRIIASRSMDHVKFMWTIALCGNGNEWEVKGRCFTNKV